MNKIFKILKKAKDPRKVLHFLVYRTAKLWPDEKYLKLFYYLSMGKKLNLLNPRTFNEKLQWLKLHDRKPIYTTMVDKYEAKKYVANIIGEEYIIPTYGVWNNFDEIDFDKLPNQFVLKCTHDSGGVVIVKNKKEFDISAARKKLNKSLKKNYYIHNREWPYKNVKPRIIAEKYMVDESGYELKDYKIFCFNGVPEYVEVDFNRAIEHKLNPYDFDWNPLNFCDKSKNDYSADIKKPERLEDMRRIAAKLSEGLKFIRVDMYSIYDKIYVGELTLYPGSGFIEFNPESTDLKYGKLLKL
ncbi:MAG: glycosyl transferase [Prevotella sp.]|nr:glycosyl transferase [Prevotella sp.]